MWHKWQGNVTIHDHNSNNFEIDAYLPKNNFYQFFESQNTQTLFFTIVGILIFLMTSYLTNMKSHN